MTLPNIHIQTDVYPDWFYTVVKYMLSHGVEPMSHNHVCQWAFEQFYRQVRREVEPPTDEEISAMGLRILVNRDTQRRRSPRIVQRGKKKRLSQSEPLTHNDVLNILRQRLKE